MFTKERQQTQEGLTAFIGQGTVLKGTLTFDGVVRIDGQLEGQIMSRGTLVVGAGAVVQAEIQVAKVVISGRIIGNIQASEGVQLMSPGAFQGVVRTPSFSIEEGAQFNGTCEMGKIVATPPPRLERYPSTGESERESGHGPGNGETHA